MAVREPRLATEDDHRSSGETLDEVFVTDDQIWLVWKCPPDDRGD
jgi:hypothetical protein